MKILIFTQKVDKNDSVLGFFHRWIIEFAKNFEFITVVCLYKGEYSLPENVKVISLGKESGVSRIKYLMNFYSIIFSQRNSYDKVFIHMNQVYALLGGVFWKMMNKDLYLWYTHKSVTSSLKMSLFFVKKVFTASAESFRIKTHKLKVMSHGIDLDLFSFDSNKIYIDKLRLITIGRISRSKDLMTILNSIDDIKGNMNIEFNIVGTAVTKDDQVYFEKVKKFIMDKDLNGIVNLLGSKTQEEIAPLLKSSDLFVHTSSTGSLDKAPLEAMAVGTVVISSNDALVPILKPYGLTFTHGNSIELAKSIEIFKNSNNKSEIRLELRKMVSERHSLVNLIKNLKQEMN